MCGTLGLGGHCPRLNRCGIGLLQDHRLMGGQLRREFSSRTGLLIGLRQGQTTSCSFIKGIHIQRDRWHNSTAWYVRHHRDHRDARFFHRKGVLVSDTCSSSSSKCRFSYTGLSLLDPRFANVLVWRLH